MSIASSSPRVHSQKSADRDTKGTKPRPRPTGTAKPNPRDAWPAWTDLHVSLPVRRTVPVLATCS